MIPYVNPEADLLERCLPMALAKACQDEFDYAMGLKSGLILYFTQARYDAIQSPDWIHIEVRPDRGYKVPDSHASDWGEKVMIFERGIDIRVSEIAWVADAPFGS